MTPDELIALIDRAAEEGWTELDLSGQGLTVLPPEIGKLTQLETLILGKCGEGGNGRIDGKQKTICPNTYWVTMLTTLPLEISQLESLSKLNLSGNPLAGILASVFQLPNLASLTAVSRVKKFRGDASSPTSPA